MLIDSVTLIVRSVNERSTSGCVLLLSQIFNNKKIHVTNVTPFSEAIKEMFDIAIKENNDWLFCIDADVFVNEEGVGNLFKKAFTVSEDVFQIQGLILDKFFGVYRPAGNHLYRTSFVEKAISLIPEEGTSVRPETDMLNRMSKAGYPWVQCDAIVGIHDYEQFYSDIYRKCFLQAHKHEQVIAYLEIYWNDMSTIDTDFQAALWGTRSGKLYNNTVLVDKRFMEKEAMETLSLNQTKEKEPISDISNLALFVKQTLNNYRVSDFEVLQEKIFPKSLWNRTIDLKASSKTISLINRVMYTIRGILIGIENKLKKIIKVK